MLHKLKPLHTQCGGCPIDMSFGQPTDLYLITAIGCLLAPDWGVTFNNKIMCDTYIVGMSQSLRPLDWWFVSAHDKT